MIKNFISTLEALLFFHQKKNDLIESENEKAKLSKHKTGMISEEFKLESKVHVAKGDRLDLTSKFIFAIFTNLCWILESHIDQESFMKNFNDIFKDLISISNFLLKEEVLILSKLFMSKNLLDIEIRSLKISLKFFMKLS